MDQTAGPSIFKSPVPERSGTEGRNNSAGFFRNNKLKLVMALIVLVILAVIFGGRSLFSPSGSGGFNILAPRVNGLTESNLSLVPDKASYRAGDQVMVNVKLYTGGYTTDSTDLVVKYDPAFLAPSEKGFALAGDIYSEYPAMQIDKSEGLIGISGITVPGATRNFNTVGIFATLYFTAVKDGQTQIGVEFVKDETSDSNVVLTGSTQDILGSVGNADILISGADTQAPQTNDQSCKSFTQACLDGSGNSGTQVCTGGSTKNGSCGYDKEFTVSCSACQI